jgi:hypothetical protein
VTAGAADDGHDRILSGLQDELESIYRVEPGARVTDFVIDRARWVELSGSGAPEELVVVQTGDDVELGLFLDEGVYRELLRPQIWTHARIAAHCQAVEGVSHFLYLAHRAQLPRPVSQLELELQAEIDKFATLVLNLWASGRRGATATLRSVLFERVSYRQNLSVAAREMYEKANFLARLYCRFLEARYVVTNSIEGFLADLRRMYRLGAAEKLSYAAQGAAL